MVYSFELIKHANIRYREKLPVLACCELSSMLHAIGISCDILEENLGGSHFLTFECRELNSEELSYLSGHSSVVFLSEKKNGLLRPLLFDNSAYLPDDLPEVLKYKGKTGTAFTRMMINTALALTPFRAEDHIPVVFDPLCGKGTCCFCAAAAGLNSIGLDSDRKEIREAADYFSRYLRFHKLKHEVNERSGTVSGRPVPITEFRFADTKAHYLSGDIRSLIFACADTEDSPSVIRKKRAHVIAADLPYGIQHAPRSSSRPEPLLAFLWRSLPAWKQSLEPGGAIALSFNTLTLSSRDVLDSVSRAGFRLMKSAFWYGLTHDVEHAVVRDVVFALNTEEDPAI